DVQWQFHELAQKHLRNSSAETNWLLENWGFVLEALEQNHQSLIGGVDWITKKWLLETFMEAEELRWNHPWLQSIDLEYHNIDPVRGLFFSVTPGKRIAAWNNSLRRPSATHVPPVNTRASGRAHAVSRAVTRSPTSLIGIQSPATAAIFLSWATRSKLTTKKWSGF
ncbi:MAG: hypothetical protein DMF43_03225, partial [Verrucomicrobia bacterium]